MKRTRRALSVDLRSEPDGVSPHHLHAYAMHAAWLEDHRREANGDLIGRALTAELFAPASRIWCGYWKRGAGLRESDPHPEPKTAPLGRQRWHESYIALVLRFTHSHLERDVSATKRIRPNYIVAGVI